MLFSSVVAANGPSQITQELQKGRYDISNISNANIFFNVIAMEWSDLPIEKFCTLTNSARIRVVPRILSEFLRSTARLFHGVKSKPTIR